MNNRLFILPLVLVATLVAAQSPDQTTKFRLAQSYEQAGDFESSAKIYRELHAKDQSNALYFDGLRRTLLQLKQYDEAVLLIQQRLSGNPKDINLRGQLGSVLYKAGKELEAYKEWDNAIATEPANPNVYRALSQVMVENRLLERAADLYRRARVACNDQNLFTADLAHLLAVTMDYAGATREYLRLMAQNPAQLGFIQGRMAGFTGKEEGRTAALGVVLEEVRSNSDMKLYQLLGWLYLEGKKFSEAFDVYKKIDDLSKAQGAEVYAFAERAYREGAYDIAAKAYLEAIETPLTTNRMPYAKYGYASALKEISVLLDTIPTGSISVQLPVSEMQSRYAGAVAYFRRIIKEYPTTEFSARSYFQIGTIQFERYFDLDGALASFEQVEREIPGMGELRHGVALKIGEVLVAKGDTGRAAARFRSVAAGPNATPDQQDESTYRLAEIMYFGGNFEGAIELLANIALNLKADYANDALQLLAFLQENTMTAEPALRDFARADFLARQRKNTEAIPQFLAVIEKYPRALLVDDALMKVAALQSQANLYADALASYERLLTQFKESSIALDRAQFNVAEVYQFGLHDTAKAIATYEKLLGDHPNSLLVAAARKRIRDLRGDSL
ncbi:MAG: tetratricopeptide repeat protein [Bacteroidota bacterium]